MQILQTLLCITSAVFWIQPMEPLVSIARETVPGNYELCNAVAISPECAVTLSSFSCESEPFLISGDSILRPDSVILFRDMGLSMLRFSDDTFSSWRLPSDVLPNIGDPLMIVGQGISGIVAVQAYADSQTADGAIILSTSPYSGLMGAPVFDTENRLVGIVTGVIDVQSTLNTRESRVALLPTQLWYMWAQLAMFEEDYTGPSFGVTAMSFTCTDLDGRPAGILLISVTEGSPADSAGLMRGDLITEINGMRVYHPETLRGMVITSDEPFDVKVLRDSTTLDLVID
jgi:hypothetical protein